MTTRTDVHSPKNLVTEDYTYVGAFDASAGDPGARGGTLTEFTVHGVTVEAFSPVGAEKSALITLLALSEGKRPHGGSWFQCDHCGAHLRYVAVVYHEATDTHLAIGETCLDNRFARATVDFQRIRKAAELDRKAQRIIAAAAEFVAGLPEGEVADLLGDKHAPLDEAPWNLSGYALSTITDIRRKLYTYGDLSERQVAFVGKLLVEAREKAAEAAKRAEARANEVRIPAPEGRVEVIGTVVHRRSVWSDYAGLGGGYVWKIIVKDDRGFAVWLSEPSSIETNLGDRVKVRATLTRSDRDESFAFGKRPSNAEIIGHTDGIAEEVPSALD